MDRVGPKKGGKLGNQLKDNVWDKHGCMFFVWMCVLMILPQVHLRKPCYDFSFLEMFRFK